MKNEDNTLYIPLDDFGIVRLKNMNVVHSILLLDKDISLPGWKHGKMSSIAKIKEVLEKMGVEVE